MHRALLLVSLFVLMDIAQGIHLVVHVFLCVYVPFVCVCVCVCVKADEDSGTRNLSCARFALQ